MAQAVLFALQNQLPEHLYNVGTGTDVTIKELAETIQTITGHHGAIVWDTDKPDGTPRKLMDSCKMLNLGWTPAYDLKTGINHTYNWFIKKKSNIKKVKLK